MPKCSNCRKADAVETRWEKIRYWLAVHLFPQDFIDSRANAHTQGFGDGYKLGSDHARENQERLYGEAQDKANELHVPAPVSGISSRERVDGIKVRSFVPKRRSRVRKAKELDEGASKNA